MFGGQRGQGRVKFGLTYSGSRDKGAAPLRLGVLATRDFRLGQHSAIEETPEVDQGLVREEELARLGAPLKSIRTERFKKVGAMTMRHMHWDGE